MNFNHLMESKHTKRRCTPHNQECYWIPIGSPRSTHGENVHMMMVCRHCGKREDIFLAKEDYEIYERTILKELKTCLNQ
jgi:hypothetical protein